MAARSPHPATENRLKAIGAFAFWPGSAVEAERPGNRTVHALDLAMRLADVDDFDPGAAAIATGIPDEADGVFQITGLATRPLRVGAIPRRVSWTGAPAGTSPDVEGAPDRGRRRPADDRSARNRVRPRRVERTGASCWPRAPRPRRAFGRALKRKENPHALALDNTRG